MKTFSFDLCHLVEMSLGPQMDLLSMETLTAQKEAQIVVRHSHSF